MWPVVAKQAAASMCWKHDMKAKLQGPCSLMSELMWAQRLLNISLTASDGPASVLTVCSRGTELY